VQSFKKAEAWEGLIHGSVIYAVDNSALVTDIYTLQHNLFTTSDRYYCMCMCQYSWKPHVIVQSKNKSFSSVISHMLVHHNTWEQTDTQELMMLISERCS